MLTVSFNLQAELEPKLRQSGKICAGRLYFFFFDDLFFVIFTIFNVNSVLLALH